MLFDRCRNARRRLCQGVIAASALLGFVAISHAATPNSWPFGGSDIEDSHASYSPSGPAQLSPSTAASLRVKWTFRTNNSISATPTVEPGGLYVPDWSGTLYKIDPASGTLIWSHPLSFYTGTARSYARASPAIYGNTIIVGDRAAGRVMAINKGNGALIWSTLVDTHPNAAISSSPVVYNGVIYLGIASTEESAGITKGYVPTFRGSVAALNAATGKVLWKFYTVPAGYSGGGVWGSNLAISTAYQWLFVSTGNNYGIPADKVGCVTAAGSDTGKQLACLDPSNFVDAVLALNLADGHIRWSRRFQGADAWTVGCLMPGKPGCPTPEGPDNDFGSAPNLVALKNFTGVRDDLRGTSNGLLLGAGEKSGIYWGINPANGGLFWSNHIPTASIQWGSAVGNLYDHNYIFVGINNGGHGTSTWKGRIGGAPVSWNGGGWAALDAYSGKTVWEIPGSAKDLVNPSFKANAPGFVSFSNNLVFAGDTGGTLYAIDAHSGYVYWTFPTGVTVESAPAVFNDTLYWGVGYPNNVTGHTLYAFGIP